MIHHVHGARTVLACALLALVAALHPVNAAAEGGSFTSLAESGQSFQPAAASPVITPAAPTATVNGLLRFTSKVEFQTAFPGLPIEDFEESPVAAGGYLWCTAPINSSTNNSCFLPGDILPGLSIDSLLPPDIPTQALHVAGNGYAGIVVSDEVGEGAADKGLEISFTGTEVYAAGMDLSVYTNAPGTIKIYGPSNTLLDTINQNLTTTPTFLGIYSSQAISRITIESPDWELVDNIQFGGSPSTLSFSTSQATFAAAHPGLPVEDFEESMVTDTGILHFTGPLDSTSNIPGVFSPGDILPGLRINGLTSTAMATIGGNYTQGVNIGNTTKVVLVNSIPDGQRFDFFNYDAYAVGMDLMRAWNPGNVVMAVYGPHGVLLGTTTRMVQLSETFVGVYSNQPITRIEVLENTDVVLVDNIRFGGSPAGLTFYNSEASFLVARPGLPVEDFQESPVAPGGFKSLPPPINSTTNVAGAFVPGDILPGISFQMLTPSAGTEMVILGDGFFGAPTTVVGPNLFADNLEMTFAKKNVRYFGTDAVVLAGGPADMLFSIYDDHNNFIGSALRNIGTTPVFLGVISTKHISRITLTNPGSPGELVDNVSFGAFPWHTIIPAISGH